MLRVIGIHDGSIPSVIPDGIYGPQTMTAVSAFQRNHGLPTTGVVDNQTWDSIVYAYRPARTQLAAANSVSIFMDPGQVICRNQHWYFLPVAQAMLTVMSQAYPEIPSPTNSGTMDEATSRSLQAFQKCCSLPETGELDKESWKHLALHFPPNASRLERMNGQSTEGELTSD